MHATDIAAMACTVSLVFRAGTVPLPTQSPEGACGACSVWGHCKTSISARRLDVCVRLLPSMDSAGTGNL